MNTEPAVSIVVPARRASETIARALRSVNQQDYQGSIEVVVAAADDPTAEIARRLQAIVVPNPSGTTPAGLNRAIAASSGDIIVRVDAHSELPPDYVSRAVSLLKSTGAGNVGGIQNPVGRSFWERAIAASMKSRFGAGAAPHRVGGIPGPAETVYLGSYPREVLDRLGGFNESYLRHQDYELNQRIRESGGTVWFDPSLVVEYQPRSSVGSLARQYFQYGSWKRRFAKDYPGKLKPRQLGPPILVGALTLGVVGSIAIPVAAIIPLAYAAGLLLAAASQLPKAGSAAIGVPVALCAMHLSWGIGFLFGHTSDK